MHGRITVISASRKSPEELRERAVRMAVEACQDPERSRGTIRRIAGAGRSPRGSVHLGQEGRDRAGHRSTTDEAQRIRELEAENRELRRANTILKSVSAFFEAELDRPSR